MKSSALPHLHNALYPNHNLSAMNSTQRADQLVQWLRDYGSERINSYLIDKRRCIPPHIILDFGNQGLFALQTPEKYGGLALTQWDTVRVLEQLSAIDPTLGLFVSLQSVLAQLPVQHANTATRDYLLTRMAQGRELMGFALTEPHAGSNPLAMQSVAKPDGQGGWQLFGEKIWIGAAAWASSLVVFAQVLNVEGKAQGISAFVIRQGTAGLRQGEEALTMGIRGVIQNHVYLEGVAVSKDNLLGRIGTGFRIAQEAMMIGRLLIGTACLATMKKSTQIAQRYASHRQIAGGLLVENSISREHLSEITAMTLSIESLLYASARHWDQSNTMLEEVLLVCKSMATEFAWQTVDRAMQLLGGRGYIETNELSRLLRDTRITRVFEGPTETLLAYLGLRVLRQGTAPLMRFLTTILHAKQLSDQLQLDIQEIAALHNNNMNYAYLLIGEVSAWAVLLAMVQQRQKHEDVQGLLYTEKWLQYAYQKHYKQALDWQGLKPTALSSEALQSIINHYDTSIADIQQHMAGEQHHQDDLLC